jgi:tetratricopeptide (TPR) repeat protein
METACERLVKSLDRPEMEFEIEFFERVLARDADHVEALYCLGHLYTESCRYGKGLAVDERLARLCPNDPLAHYNLACSYSLTEKVDKSLEVLARAIRLGYRDYKHMSVDPDLANVRSSPGWQRLMDLKLA